MTATDALHIDGLNGGVGVTSGREARLAQSVQVHQASLLSVRYGVLPAPGLSPDEPLQVTGTSSTSPWQYRVAAGGYVGTKGSSDGAYIGTNDGAYLVASTAPPTSNARYDVIYIISQNSAATIGPDATTTPLIGVAHGAASATPVAPAVPVGALSLALAYVPSTATAGTSDAAVTITPIAQYTVMAGGVLPVRGTGEYPSAATAMAGTIIFDIALGYPLYFPGGGGQPVPLVDTYPSGQTAYIGSAPPAGTRVARQRGTAVVTTTSGGAFAFSYPVAFANGLTTVQLTVGDGGSGVTAVGSIDLVRANVTTTGLFGIAYSPSGTALASQIIRVNWLAEGW